MQAVILSCKVNRIPSAPDVRKCISSILMYYRAEKFMAKKQKKVEQFVAKWEKIVDLEDNIKL